IKFTESGGMVDDSGKGFTANNPGHSVLLFTETSSVGRAGKVETFHVRVVKTRLYDSDGPPLREAIIGQTLRSSYDTAGLGTGFVFNRLSRYNVNVHNRDRVSGPVIPVNLHPSSGKSEKLVVVWYETRDRINWPYQAEQFNPRWPTLAEGLNRIVIA